MVMRHSQGDEENAWDEEAKDDGEEGAELHVKADCDRKQARQLSNCLLISMPRVRSAALTRAAIHSHDAGKRLRHLLQRGHLERHRDLRRLKLLGHGELGARHERGLGHEGTC